MTRRTSSEQIADAWLRENRLPERARRGAEIFDIAGCLACHTYLDAGVRSLGAPELTAIGAKRGRDEGYFVRYVSDPAAFGNDVMPKFESLGRANLRALAVFLESSRGGR